MKNATVQDLQTALQQGDSGEVAFIDVRTPEEFGEARIPGTVNMPLDHLQEFVSELKNKQKVYVNCRSGGRSMVAAVGLEQAGLTGEIYNVDGGLLAWHEAGLPIEQ